ncbi:MAG: hypothetical protein RI904_2871, partial [Pseudomonadota bacterium]
GRPKGVGNAHRAVVNHMDWMQDTLALGPADRILQKTAIGFDVAVFEWFVPLMAGATLVMRLMIRKHGITVIHFVTSMLNAFLDDLEGDTCPTLRQIVSSGEAVTGPVQHKTFAHFPDVLLWDFYGPTEAAIHVSTWQCQPSDGYRPPPIGYPIWNTQLYILDANLQPVPHGIVGELYIAGEGVARGYIGRAALTAERFIASPFGPPGLRMYRTGDLARRRMDHAIEYLGRADGQLKIRGYRIELGEIEVALLKSFSDRLARAVVIVRERGDDKRLVAYLVPRELGSLPSELEIRSVLGRTLPDYMVPSAFVELERLPLTPNGKLDVKALPEPDVMGTSDFRAPVSEHEQLIAALFGELTGAKRVGLDDSFFELGGHSLLAMRLVAQLRARLGHDVALRLIFEHPTVQGLAQVLDELLDPNHVSEDGLAVGAVSQRPLIAAGQGAHGTERALSYGQIRLWTLEQIEGATGSYNVPAAFRLSGELDLVAFNQALVDIITRHEPLRTYIVSQDGEPVGHVQALASDAQILVFEDLSAQAGPAREAALERVIKEDSVAPFDLSRDLMLRARLLKLGPAEHALVLVMHHIASDGVSVGVFCQELTQAYAARSVGQSPQWSALEVSYADYAAWQREWLEGSGALKAQSESWQAQLAGIPELLGLPVDFARTADRSREAGYHPVQISAQTARTLQSLANTHQTTVFTVLIALFGTLLGRLANQTDVVIGSPVAGRTSTQGVLCEHAGLARGLKRSPRSAQLDPTHQAERDARTRAPGPSVREIGRRSGCQPCSFARAGASSFVDMAHSGLARLVVCWIEGSRHSCGSGTSEV